MLQGQLRKVGFGCRHHQGITVKEQTLLLSFNVLTSAPRRRPVIGF